MTRREDRYCDARETARHTTKNHDEPPLTAETSER
jgi:hypothetical protein